MRARILRLLFGLIAFSFALGSAAAEPVHVELSPFAG
jgi:hypothetical protein